MLLTVGMLSACSQQNKDAENSAEAETADMTTQQADTPKRDISTAALVKIDDAIQAYDDRVEEAKSAYAKAENDETKAALIDAYVSFADYMTYESTVSPREGKYHRALIEYRHVVELDPTNTKAASEIAQIEDIYRSMNRPVPGTE
jgi:tetratricopeptide (TPR) repeat protein